jgi:hypothetical protein
MSSSRHFEAWDLRGSINVWKAYSYAALLVQKAAACASTISLEPQKWQKERLVKLRLLGEGAQPACLVGRGSPSGSLAHGVDQRLMSAMQILCAPSKQALEPRSTLKPLVEAASLALLKLYLESIFEESGLDVVEAQVRVPLPEGWFPESSCFHLYMSSALQLHSVCL